MKDLLNDVLDAYQIFSMDNLISGIDGLSQEQGNGLDFGNYLAGTVDKNTDHVYVLLENIEVYDSVSVLGLEYFIHYLEQNWKGKVSFIFQVSHLSNLEDKISKLLLLKVDDYESIVLTIPGKKDNNESFNADEAELISDDRSRQEYITLIGDSLSNENFVTSYQISELLYIIGVSPIPITINEIRRLTSETSLYGLGIILKTLLDGNLIRKRLKNTYEVTYEVVPVFRSTIMHMPIAINESIGSAYKLKIFENLNQFSTLDYERIAAMAYDLNKASLSVSYCFSAVASGFLGIQSINFEIIQGLINKAGDEQLKQIYTDYVSAWRLFKNGDLRVAATYSDQILKKSSETSPKISSLTPVVSGEVLFLYTTILTRMNSKKVKDMNLDLVLWKDQLELKDTDLRLRLDELILQTTRGIQPSESLERFLELQKSYLKEINETSIWEANVWSVKYAIFLSHINAYDWSGTGENKAKYFENAIKLVEQRSSKNAGLYLDILNNAAGDFYWRDSAYVKKALQIITQVTKLSNKELPDNLAGIYAYNKIIMSVYSVNKQKSINCILN